MALPNSCKSRTSLNQKDLELGNWLRLRHTASAHITLPEINRQRDTLPCHEAHRANASKRARHPERAADEGMEALASAVGGETGRTVQSGFRTGEDDIAPARPQICASRAAATNWLAAVSNNSPASSVRGWQHGPASGSRCLSTDNWPAATSLQAPDDPLRDIFRDQQIFCAKHLTMLRVTSFNVKDGRSRLKNDSSFLSGEVSSEDP